MSETVWVDPVLLVSHPDLDMAGSTLSVEDGKYKLIKESIQRNGQVHDGDG